MAIFKSKSVTLPIIGILRNFSGMFLLSIEIFLIGGNEGLSKLTHPTVYCTLILILVSLPPQSFYGYLLVWLDVAEEGMTSQISLKLP